MRKLGCATESTIDRIYLSQQTVRGIVKPLDPISDLTVGELCWQLQPPRALLTIEVAEGLRLLLDIRPTRAIVLRQSRKHRGKTRHPIAIARREVRSAIEWRAIGCQEDGHRPAAMPRQRLHRIHVERVNIGTLLAVYFDAHVIGVHEFGDGGVLE